jgi:transcriptional regulator with XRE-family HTH domain
MTYDFTIIRHLRKRLGLTIFGLSEKCGVSYVALSKLERNLGNPELKTLDKIARSLGLETHNLLALAEHDRPKIIDTKEDVDVQGISGLVGRVADFQNVKIIHGRAPRGAKAVALHQHSDDYEICLVLSGRLQLHVRDSAYDIGPGQAVRFDCIFDHFYEVVEDVVFVHVLVAKRG